MEERAGGPGAPPGPAAAASAGQPRGEQAHGPTSAGPTPEVVQQPTQPQARGRRQLYDDYFMMWVWKVEMCKRVDKHERESCPYSHPGELARRRHPSLYQALPCPEARAKKICPRLENCNCSHSTFEYWLHPSRYKTFLCERGEACDRPICFFAHTPAELRELPEGLQRTQPAPRHAPPEAAAATLGGSSSPFSGHHPPSGQGAASSSLQQGYTSSSSWAYQQQAGQYRGASAGEPQQGLGARQLAQQLPGSPMLAMHPPGGGSSGMARPEAHRGATVAVIPAGPSVWQNNSLLQSESGEAPNLEELCAAVTRLAMQQADQASDQVAWQQQQQQHVQQPSLAAVAAVPAQLPAPVMGLQQGMPDVALLPVYAGHQQPVQQQPASQQPQQQQVMLPNGQVILVQVPGGSSPAQMPWSSLQPPNG